MEHVDPALAQRVWQRVQGGKSREQEAWLALAGLEQLQGAAYMQLSRRFLGKTAAMLLQLGQRKRARTACLKGLCRLLTGEGAVLPPVKPELSDNARAALCLCCTREGELLRGYEAEKTHPVYGQVFGLLAEQTRADFQTALTLLGEMEN